MQWWPSAQRQQMDERMLTRLRSPDRRPPVSGETRGGVPFCGALPPAGVYAWHTSGSTGPLREVIAQEGFSVHKVTKAHAQRRGDYCKYPIPVEYFGFLQCLYRYALGTFVQTTDNAQVIEWKKQQCMFNETEARILETGAKTRFADKHAYGEVRAGIVVQGVVKIVFGRGEGASCEVFLHPGDMFVVFGEARHRFHMEVVGLSECPAWVMIARFRNRLRQTPGYTFKTRNDVVAHSCWVPNQLIPIREGHIKVEH